MQNCKTCWAGLIQIALQISIVKHYTTVDVSVVGAACTVTVTQTETGIFNK